MPGSFNKVILMGNLTRDVEVRSLPSGMTVAQFSLAVNERYKDRDGNWVDRANFIDCEMFGNRAEAFAKYLSKGSPAFIEGKLRLDQWQDKEGNKRSKLKVVADNFEFVGGRGDSGSGGGGGGGGGSYARSGAGAPQDAGPTIDHDDIPF
ncbi:MAG: single-stranded DNA-binding protein [Planctomycetota bacterium]